MREKGSEERGGDVREEESEERGGDVRGKRG